jgi:putative DNA methylase
MTPEDLRLIEDYLPIEAISPEASREKSVREGDTLTLHLWWARRPLVACRAAVYEALVRADRWVKDINRKNPPEDAEKAHGDRSGWCAAMPGRIHFQADAGGR